MLVFGGRLRFSRLLEQVEGISQKSLTKILRQLERDGLVTRTVFVQVPLRVEYELTPLAGELLEHVTPLWTWIVARLRDFLTVRQRFDTRSQDSPGTAAPDRIPTNIAAD